jgi:photosystem II stability/assembly factor-like uncharacterized protein
MRGALGVVEPDATGAMFGSPNRILATADGGAHWRVQYVGRGCQPVALAATDPQHVWAAGSAAFAAAVLASGDGGATWRRQPVPTSAERPARAVAFADAQHDWILVDYESLLATSDGGATWQQVVLPVGAGTNQPHWGIAARDSRQ